MATGEFPLRSVVVKPGVTPNTSGLLVANSLLKANVKALIAVLKNYILVY